MYDVIIIGMGMAGITAGIYAKRAGHKVLMFEKSAPGGLLNQLNKITNYPGFEEISGPDFAMNLFMQVRKLGIEFKNEEVLSVNLDGDIKSVTTKSGTYEAKNIVIATGRAPKYLGLDNEKDYLGKGLSTCAVCDGFLYKGLDVAVVGNGMPALQESIYLSGLCNKVYLLNKTKEFRASDELINTVKSTSNIEIIYEVNIDKINEENKKIVSIVLNNKDVINVSGVFIYVGFKPDTDIFKNYNILNNNGDILVDDKKMTKLDNVYAIGDCTFKEVYQLVTAASDGAVAITNMDKIK